MQTFQPQIVHKGLLMCIMVCDLILKFEVYKIIIFKKVPEVARCLVFWTKTDTIDCY